MKKRLGILAVATAFVLAIPVAASATDQGEARPEPPPIDLEARFDTFDEAVTAVTERMANALDRMTDRYARAQGWDDAPEELLERLSAAIDQISENLVAVGDAGSFDELNSIVEEAREQRRELRGDRPHRLHRCRPPVELGNDTELSG
jgi:hypothetical protein